MSKLKDFFKPEDFDDCISESVREIVCTTANAKLNAEIESWPVVYGRKSSIDFRLFGEGKDSDDTHQARLAFVKELPKEPCKHSPHWDDERRGIPFCIHCGVELKRSWEAKK